MIPVYLDNKPECLLYSCSRFVFKAMPSRVMPRQRARVNDARIQQACEKSSKAVNDRIEHILGKRPNITCTLARNLGAAGKGHCFLLFEFACGQNKIEVKTRSDRALRGNVVPPEKWIQFAICAILPKTLESLKPSWLGDNPRKISLAFAAESEVSEKLVEITDASERKRAAIPLAQIGTSTKWICYTGVSSCSKYNLSDLGTYEVEDQDEPPLKRCRGDWLSEMTKDKSWYNNVCSISHYMAVKQSHGTAAKAEEKMMSNPFEWPSIPQKIVVRWTSGGEHFALKSLRALLRSLK